MNRKPYPSDVSDDEWAFVAPYLTLMTEEAPQREHSLREVFNPTASLVTQGTNLSSQGAISPTCLRHFQWPKETYQQCIRGGFTEVSL
jgi:hypothetical protein